MLSLWLLSACSWMKLHVELPDSGGLSQGAEVWMAGLEIGEVSSVHLAGDRVAVEVKINQGHEVALHKDACAVVLPGEPPKLQLWPGTEGELAGPVGPCKITREDLVELARDVGEGARDMARGLAQGAGLDRLFSRSSPSGRGAELPSGGPGGAALPAITAVCDRVRVTLERIEPVEKGFFLPDGGYALTIVVSNDNGVPIALPGASDVALIAGGREFSPAMLPDGRYWFMPEDIAAESARELRLVVGAEVGRGSGTVDGVAIRGVSARDSMSRCDVRAPLRQP